MKNFTILFFFAFLFGCVTKSKMIVIDYKYIDDIKQQRINLSFKNDANFTVCLTPEDWPNKGHKINQASDEVFLIVGDRKFPIQDFNTGYCPKGCEIHVKPGEEVFATIPYEEFSLPKSLYEERKILDFHPNGHACTHRNK